MENKTAVDWIWDNIKSHFEHDGDLLESVKMSFDIAKWMEKKQIMYSYHDGWEEAWEIYSEKADIKPKSMEDYYNERYGKTNI